MQHGDLALLDRGDVRALRARMRRSETTIIPVEVTTALPLPADQRQRLEENLIAEHGASLQIDYHVDAALLGGMILRVGDKLIDTSVASRLAALRQTLGVIEN